MSGTAEKDASAIIEKALHRSVRLEAFPKSQVDVYVTVLEEGGSALSCAITCASMALASAGLDMYDMVVGVQVMRLPDSLSTILVDPTLEEEKQAKGDQNFNFLFILRLSADIVCVCVCSICTCSIHACTGRGEPRYGGWARDT